VTSGRVVLLAGLAVAVVIGALVGWMPESNDAVARENRVVAADLSISTETHEPDELAELVLADAGEPRRIETSIAPEMPRPAANEVERGSNAYGLVLDLDGQPVPGVAIALRHDPKSSIATSSGDGSFPLEDVDVGYVVVDPRWSTLRDTEPLERNGRRVILVLVAPAIRVAGLVQDPTGVGIEGAEIELVIPAASFASFPEPLDRARPARTSSTTSDARGAFEFVIPSLPRATLSATKEDFEAASIGAPTTARDDLSITLGVPIRRGNRTIRGVVVHADSTPAASAIVRFGDNSTTTDGDGWFELTLEREPTDPLPLVAAKRGFQAAIVANFTATVMFASSPLPDQRLVLGPPPLAIEGRVVDHEGRPKKGWIVELVDPVLLEDGHIPPESAEALGRGSAVRATSGDDGSFRLEDLQDRVYRLQAHSAQELVRIESEPIPAGSRNVRLVVPADARFAKIDGIVVAHDKSGVAGVRVRAGLIVFRTTWGYTSEHSDGVTTDADGRFTLVNVPRSGSMIAVDGDFVLPVSYGLDTHVDGENVTIRVARRCHMRVEGVPPNANVDAVEVLDANGSTLSLVQFQSGGTMSSSQVPLTEGATPVFAVAETARTIRFRIEGHPGASRALVLRPGEITVVGW